MPANKPNGDFRQLLTELVDGRLDAAGLARLENLLSSSLDHQRFYDEFMTLHAMLLWRAGPPISGAEPDDPGSLAQMQFSDGDASPVRQAAPSLIFGHEYVLPYVAAMLVIGVALLVGSMVQISHVGKYAERTSPRGVPESLAQDHRRLVGRVTGMKDCQWSDPATQTVVGASVALDREYALSSGLMEITYTSGAKVILEGPCTYKVDSSTGGYLAGGKLTARVETKGSGFGVQDSEDRGQRSEVRNQKSHPSSLIPHPSSLFSVRTPTAVVTDLGTEFGVEVAENGDTTSYVFQGSISVQGLAASVASGATEKVLHKNESIRVSRVRETHQDSEKTETVRFTHPTIPPRFVRAIARLKKPYLDLADIVAGGDGFGNARNRGIDPVTGGLLDSNAKFDHSLKNDGRYHPVEALPMIDGVFIPDGGQGPVQLDSVGHKFNSFPDTAGVSWHYLWSGQLPATAYPPMPCWLGMANYAGPRHSVLSMPPNKGVTFDLAAIRAKHPDVQVVRFTAVAGNTEMRSSDKWASRVSADLWVFVDGELRFSKTDINANDGEFNIDIPLTDTVRFLTLAATDAGNTVEFDWTIFGDPRLHISKTKANPSGEDERPPTDKPRGKGGLAYGVKRVRERLLFS